MAETPFTTMTGGGNVTSSMGDPATTILGSAANMALDYSPVNVIPKLAFSAGDAMVNVAQRNEQRRYDEIIRQRERAEKLSDEAFERFYNSPANQVELLKKAGINPWGRVGIQGYSTGATPGQQNTASLPSDYGRVSDKLPSRIDLPSLMELKTMDLNNQKLKLETIQTDLENQGKKVSNKMLKKTLAALDFKTITPENIIKLFTTMLMLFMGKK